MNKMINHWGLAGMAIIGLGLAACPVFGNNLVVTNTSIKTSFSTSGKTGVQFDLSWDNSWRDGVNFDACWVFVKYSIDSGATWSHATLGGSGTNPAGFISGVGTNLDIIVPPDKTGAFIQRSALSVGAGSVSNTGVKFVWDFATNGVLKFMSARVKVFAIEMVYVPTGSFYLGSGGTETNSFTDGIWASGATTPFRITNETAMTIAHTAGSLWDPILGAGILSNAFPKGFAAFYLMKTEISQQQYCDFLNTLTRAQQVTRVFTINADFFAMANPASASILNRNGIRCPSVIPLAPVPIVFGCDGNTNKVFNEADDGQWVACNWLTWNDGLAYLDWAALRPYTELEFEKACRGPLAPVPNEYAWGTTSLVATTSLTGTNTASETPNPSLANCNSPLANPYRCGSYARSDSGRTNSGSGYYGALDLSGNVNERTVSLGNTAGRAFTGEHGDGVLNAGGDQNVPGWQVNGVSSHGGQGALLDNRTSDRIYYSWMTLRYFFSGGRGARTAP